MSALDEIEEYVRRQGRELSISVDTADGRPWYTISNTTPESLPLRGWKWSDVDLHISESGETLEIAWAKWKVAQSPEFT